MDRDIYQNFCWRENELANIAELEKGNKRIVYVKYSLLLLIFLPLLILILWNKPIFQESKYLGVWSPKLEFNTYYLWATAYVFIHMTSFILHYSVYSSVHRDYEFVEDQEPLYFCKRQNKKNKNIFSYFKLFCSITLTPDYYWADYFKDKMEQKLSNNNEDISVYHNEVTKIFKKYFIERSNWWNVMITTITVICILVLFGNFEYLTGPGIYLMLIVVVLRIVSRSIEILIAFYNDVVVQRDKIFISKATGNKIYINSWKNSSILSYGRVSLALHSLLEIFMIFSTLYLLMDNIDTKYIFESPKEIRDSQIGIVSYFIYSFSNTITFPDPKLDSYWAIAQSIQLLTSAVLILLSLASYIGKEQKLKNYEEKLFIELKKRI